MARFNNGWVKLWRGAVEGDLFDNALLWKLWCWILTAATWYPQNKLINGEQVELPPGTVIMGYQEVATALRCSRSTIHKWVRYLEKTERIATKSRTQGTIVTVLNWGTYQSDEDTARTSREQTSNTARTPAEHGANHNEELRKKEGREISENLSPESLAEATLTWGKTLRRLGIDKPPEFDRDQIARLIQRYGFEKTNMALLGAGFEEKSPKFDPKKHVSILRLSSRPGVFDTFVNLGAQNKPTLTDGDVVEWDL